ncbi:MAG TPA: VanZ family protein [Terriglobia bacterium]|nr:VanZ family protein [Terriglobia bacterium]
MNNPQSSVSRYVRIRAAVWKTTAVAWAGLIFYLSTGTFGGSLTASLLSQILSFLHANVSPSTFEALHHVFRKSAHLTEYAIFAILMYGSRRDEHPFDWRARRALACLVMASAYSLTDEFHQIFVPGRGPSLVDCGIDTVGAGLGLLLFYVRGWLAGSTVGETS